MTASIVPKAVRFAFVPLIRTSACSPRRNHPALGPGALRWVGREGAGQEGGELLCFAREPGFILAANFGHAPAPLPAHREVLLASGPVTGGSLPPDTAAWLSA